MTLAQNAREPFPRVCGGRGGRFPIVPSSFRTRKAIAKSQTSIKSTGVVLFHILLIGREVLFLPEVSGVYTSLSVTYKPVN